jgi:hypothetical protein
MPILLRDSSYLTKKDVSAIAPGQEKEKSFQ